MGDEKRLLFAGCLNELLPAQGDPSQSPCPAGTVVRGSYRLNSLQKLSDVPASIEAPNGTTYYAKWGHGSFDARSNSWQSKDGMVAIANKNLRDTLVADC
jgi:hypothetical protein